MEIMSIYVALVTYCMGQRPFLEADSRPATLEIIHFLKNSKIHTYKNIPLATILIIKIVKLSLCLIKHYAMKVCGGVDV
jgi:hypothetical protein